MVYLQLKEKRKQASAAPRTERRAFRDDGCRLMPPE
jgi:hypothetical protein